MHSGRQEVLAASVGARLSQRELAAATEAAGALGMTLSQWVRRAMLEALQPDTASVVLLQEFMALRHVVLHLYMGALHGERLSKEAIEAVLARADEVKAGLAESRLKGKDRA